MYECISVWIGETCQDARAEGNISRTDNLQPNSLPLYMHVQRFPTATAITEALDLFIVPKRQLLNSWNEIQILLVYAIAIFHLLIYLFMSNQKNNISLTNNNFNKELN